MTPFIKEKECFFFNGDRKKYFTKPVITNYEFLSKSEGFLIIYYFIFQNKINTRSASWYSDYVGLLPT